MRWLRFGILVLIFLVLQIGVGSALSFIPQKIVPDLLLLLAVLLIFWAPADQALIACWLLGLLKDITSQEAPLGSYSLTFGLLGLMLIRMREVVVAARLLPQIFLIFVSSMVIEHAVWLICVVKSDVPLDSYRQTLTSITLSAVITAALYPYGYWLMTKLHRPLGLKQRHK
jgi:rod shape-determining protein MreD